MHGTGWPKPYPPRPRWKDNGCSASRRVTATANETADAIGKDQAGTADIQMRCPRDGLGSREEEPVVGRLKVVPPTHEGATERLFFSSIPPLVYFITMFISMARGSRMTLDDEIFHQEHHRPIFVFALHHPRTN